MMVVVWSCNLGTQEAEAGGLQVPGWLATTLNPVSKNKEAGAEGGLSL